MCMLNDTTGMTPDQIASLISAANTANGVPAGTPAAATDPSGASNTPQLETSGNDVPNPPPPKTPADNGAGDGVDRGGKTGIAGGGDKGLIAAGPPDTGTGTPAPLPAGQTSGNTGFDPKAFLASRPDVQAAFDAENTRDQKSIDNLHSMGIYTADQYASWYANKYGGAGAGTNVGAAGGAVQQGNDLITSLTQGFNDTIKGLTDSTAAQLAALNKNNTDLTGQIQGMQNDFAKSQQDLLDNMNKTAAQQSQAFASALKDLRDASNSTGQAAHKPNYAQALAKNKQLNSTGLSSTMLTGPTGVANGAMTLGQTSLLGAA